MASGSSLPVPAKTTGPWYFPVRPIAAHHLPPPMAVLFAMLLVQRLVGHLQRPKNSSKLNETLVEDPLM